MRASQPVLLFAVVLHQIGYIHVSLHCICSIQFGPNFATIILQWSRTLSYSWANLKCSLLTDANVWYFGLYKAKQNFVCQNSGATNCKFWILLCSNALDQCNDPFPNDKILREMMSNLVHALHFGARIVSASFVSCSIFTV